MQQKSNLVFAALAGSRWLRGVTMLALLALSNTYASAQPVVFHASQSGQQTLDQGSGGGNPFASALIDALQTPNLTLADLASTIRRLTVVKSNAFQSADTPEPATLGPGLMAPAGAAERRAALVLVVSTYSGGAQSLPGAKVDAARTAQAFRQVGFDTETAIDLDLRAIRKKLAEFATRTEHHGASIIYTTGHGVEVDGKTYLIPGAYPINEGNRALATHAIQLSEIGQSLRAKRMNLLFYGGCRDNPLGG